MKVRQLRSDMRARILARTSELCRKALESPTCFCSHMRCGRSLLDLSINWAILMALLNAEFCAYDHDSPFDMLAPNFCANLVSVECLVMWSTHSHKQKFTASPWNTLAVSTEFPDFRKRRFCAYGKHSHEIGPCMVPFCAWVLACDLADPMESVEVVLSAQPVRLLMIRMIPKPTSYLYLFVYYLPWENLSVMSVKHCFSEVPSNVTTNKHQHKI